MNPIGVFDSGYGGLTVLKELTQKLPAYDYYYLGDNARAPYGSKSFDTVYEYTLQAVRWFFEQACPLVILACNTASAKALRSIQHNDLPKIGPEKRVLGVIRPTAEVIGEYSNSKHIGLFGTEGTVSSNSYSLEIKKTYPDVQLTQEACPGWVNLVENKEYDLPESACEIKMHIDRLLEKDPKIDVILLACTHYPLLENEIYKHMPDKIQLISQGEIVANSLENYLHRNTDMEKRLTKGGSRTFFTTGDPGDFSEKATFFYGENVKASRINLI